MPVEFLDPTGEANEAAGSYGLRLRTDGKAPRIGLLANSFLDSEAFLDCVQAALAHLVPGASFPRYLKPSITFPASKQLLNQISEECDALVTAWGH